MQQKSSPHQIAAILGTLLNLYWQADETPEVRKAVAKVWLEDFAEFDPAVVDEAAREWRRSQQRRPSIAEFRRLCHEGQANANFRADRALPKPPGAPEKWMSDLWRDGGTEAREAAIRANEERYRKADQWRQERTAAAAGKPAPTAPEPKKPPTPEWINERDRQRADAKAKDLGLDKLDGWVDRFMADLPKPVPAEPEDLDAEAAA